MKKLLFLFTSILILSSCSKDDDSSNEGGSSVVNANNFVGTWELTDIQTEATANTFFVQNIEIPLTISTEDYNMSAVISEDPNEYNFDGTVTLKTEFTNPLNNEVVATELKDQSLEGLDSGSWEIIGNSVIFTPTTGDSSTLTIQSLNENILILKQVNEVTETNSDFGIELDITVSSESIITFTK